MAMANLPNKRRKKNKDKNMQNIGVFKIYSDGEKKKILGLPPCNIWIIIFG